MAKSATKIVPAGSIMVGIRVGVGKVAINAVPMCTSQDIVSLIGVDERKWNKEFISLVLQHKAPILAAQAQGATITGISSKTLKTITVPALTLAFQDEIVSQLRNIEQQIAHAKNQLAQLNSLVKSRFVEMFGNPKLEPDKWELRPLGDVCSTRLGKMLDAKKQTGECSYPYLANANVQWFHFELSDLRRMDFSEEDRVEFALNNGDVLVTEGGEIGRCAIWREELKDCYFQKAVHRVRCNTDCLLPEYFVWCFKMKSDHGLFEPYVSRSTIAHLTGKKIKQVPIPLPPLDLQNDFAAFASQVDKSRQIAQQQIEKLQVLYKSLAQEYFSQT